MKRTNQERARKLGDGYPVPKVHHRKARGKKSARLLIKCGDCENKFEIYYGPQGEDLEIAGVLASVENWRRILLPLLKKPAGKISETDYLLGSAANAKRLISAVNALNRGKVTLRPGRS
jgi:hypothetical protein